MKPIQKQLELIEGDIQSACAIANRSRDEITLLAVSKKRTAAELQALFELGVTHFGESYWQEAEAKLDTLKELAICWHFIGPIQSNKTKPIAENFAWVHSIDSLKIATRLHKQRPTHLPPIKALIQVNIDQEETKSGVMPDDVAALLAQTGALDRLTICGLMCIPSNVENVQQTCDSFARLRKLREELLPIHPNLHLLSMGMSKDFTYAIQEGSNIVRIGTALFGPRPSK